MKKTTFALYFGNRGFFPGESIADACAVHGTNADELIAKLNAHLGNK